MKKFGLVLFIFIAASCFSQNDHIILLPDVGINIGKDTFFLNSANPKSVADRLNIKDTADILGLQWSGFDTDGNPVYGEYQQKNIKFKGVEFEFRGPKADSLSLICIYINPETAPFDIILSQMNLRQKTTDILKIYPNSSSLDISGNTFSEYGVLFKTDTINNKPIISLVSINSKYTKTK
jgi:hypothetical protein